MPAWNTSKYTQKCKKIIKKWQGHGCVRTFTYWEYHWISDLEWFCIVPSSDLRVVAMITGAHFSHKVRGQRNKIYSNNVDFGIFENKLVNAALSQCAVSKTITYLETSWKMSPTVLTFSFSVMSFSGRELDLKIGKFSQISNDPSSSICCRFCQW